MTEMLDRIWFTGDHHFGHINVLKYAERPYNSVAEMDEDLIGKWNDRVDQFDTVYHLGDFTLGGLPVAKHYFGRLNGTINILNNSWHHDKRWMEYSGQCSTKSGSAVLLKDPLKVLEIDGLGKDGYPLAITLCHYPIENGSWDRAHYGSLHFHGHCHGNLPKRKNSLDVGVDMAHELLGEYRPFSLREAIHFATID